MASHRKQITREQGEQLFQERTRAGMYREGAENKLAKLLRRQQATTRAAKKQLVKLNQLTAQQKKLDAEVKAMKAQEEKWKRLSPEYYAQQQAKLKKVKKLVPKSQMRVKNIRLTMNYVVRVWEGNGVSTDIEKSDNDYFAITYASKEEYDEKLERAQNDMYKRIDYEMVSGAEIIAHDFVVDNTLTGKQLRATASNPSKLVFYKNGKAPKDYQFLPADLNQAENGISCLDSYLLETYKKDMPTLCQEELNRVMGGLEVLKDQIDPNAPKGVPHRTCEAAQLWCAKRKVAHYALDMDGHLFFKHLNDSHRNYKPLIYYVADAHMYICNDEATIKHIVRSAAGSENGAQTGSSAKNNIANGTSDAKKEQRMLEKIALFQRPMFEDISFEFLHVLPDGVNVFYHQLNLHELAKRLFNEGDQIGKMFHTGDKMTRIYLEKREINLFSNANHRLHMDWKDSKKVCDALELPWTNQSLPELAGEYFSKNFHVKGEKMWKRCNIPKEVKAMINKRQKGLCAMCKQPTGSNYETDHIHDLGQGGVPLGTVVNGKQTYNNLQSLCKKPCHEKKTRQEQAQRIFKQDQTMSSYNEDVHRIFMRAKNGFIHNFDVEKRWELRVKQGITYLCGFDINKCRTEILYRNKFNFPVYSCLDNVEVFDVQKHGTIPIGYYYVKTGNFLPMKGSGWYSYPLVRFCLAQGIITTKHITHALPSSIDVAADYYNDFIRGVREKLDPKMAKIAINSFIGCFGHKVSKRREVRFTTSLNEASYFKFSTTETDTKRIYVHKEDDDELIEVVTHMHEYVKSSRVPIFNMILDLEAIELYKLKQVLCANGAKPIHYNTDNVIVECKTLEEVGKLTKVAMATFWDAEKKFPKYKFANEIRNSTRTEKNDDGEELIDLSLEQERTMVFQEYKMDDREYEVIRDPGTNDFSSLVKQLVERVSQPRGHFQLDGRAGTGKTTLLRLLIAALKEKYGEDKILCLAPTNKACRVLGEGAETLHTRWSIMKNSKFDTWNYYEVVIIDEKSMCMEYFLETLSNVVRSNAKCRFVIAGDWAQLPPVNDRSADFDYMGSKAIWEISGGCLVQLTKCRRSDDVLFNICKNVADVKRSDFGEKDLPRSFCYTNSFRRQVNKYWMEKLGEGKYSIKFTKHEDNREGQDMTVFCGMPVIACITHKLDAETMICNSDEFEVFNWSKPKKTIQLRTRFLDGREEEYVNLDWDVFTRIMQPGFCQSIYKAQGITVPAMEEYTIHQFDKMQQIGDKGMRLLYVAMSRARDVKQINLRP